MAGIALGSRRDMGNRLHLGIDGQVGATVAGRAVARYGDARAGVVHLGRGEGNEIGVANIAGDRSR
jgi:hypothetical protein